jgi:Rad3-related DNA helicase
MSPIIRESSKIKLETSILIFDEAHNIEKDCCAAGSIEIIEDVLKAF